MPNDQHGYGRPVVIVVGCDEIGSAIAHEMHCAGYAVVLIDDVDPAWSRRGMSYVDAWYVGGATLERIDACFCASIRSIPAILARGDMIAATAWSWEGVAEKLKPRAVIETRRRQSAALAPCRPPVLETMLAIGVRTVTVGGWAADAVICAQPPADSLDDATANISDCHSHRVVAPHAGRFRTRHEITDWIDAGDVVGEVGTFVAIAPASGVLTALSARGARIAAGQLIAEIGTRARIKACFGISSDARAIAHRVRAAIRRGKGAGRRWNAPGKPRRRRRNRDALSWTGRHAGVAIRYLLQAEQRPYSVRSWASILKPRGARLRISPGQPGMS